MVGRRKVLHVGKYFPPFAGGMEHYLRDLMQAQSGRGTAVAALVHRSTPGLWSTRETYAAGGQSLPVTRAAVWWRFLFTPVSPTFPLLLSRLLRSQRPDILHLHLPNVSAFWALLLPAARRVPWVVHWHADVLASEHSLGLRLFYRFYRPWEKALLRRCRAVIATSPPYLESSAPLRTVRDKCHVVPLGLAAPDTDGAREQPARRVDPQSPLRLLAVGRLSYYKGFEYLLRACAEAPQSELRLVGEGDQRERLQRLAAELDLGERVLFLGHLPDAALAGEFDACDCLCLPSIERTEAFGMVLLEAMQRGRATIVSDVPGSGMGWVVDDQVTGLHVAPRNTASLAAAIRILQADRDKLRRLGEQGRIKFNDQFRIASSAAGVDEVYETVLRGTAENRQAGTE